MSIASIKSFYSFSSTKEVVFNGYVKTLLRRKLCDLSTFTHKKLREMAAAADEKIIFQVMMACVKSRTKKKGKKSLLIFSNVWFRKTYKTQRLFNFFSVYFQVSLCMI